MTSAAVADRTVPAADAAARTWTLLIAAPCKHININDSHGRAWAGTSKLRKEWRKAAYKAAAAAQLPKGLDRVRIDIVLHFTRGGHRDALNYADTAKPVIDAFGPPFRQAPTEKRPNGTNAPGWLLIPDDTPEHLEASPILIGPVWREMLAGLTVAQQWRLQSQFGGLTVTITDLTGQPVTAAPASPEQVAAAQRDALVRVAELATLTTSEAADPAALLSIVEAIGVAARHGLAGEALPRRASRRTGARRG